jgi:UDP-3-O-[3-hydroxymyristoyl] N-acetylglucosamine deacetylase
MLQQRTLKTLTRAVGVGLHSGQRVELTLRPAQPDTGIVFRRVDLPQPVDIPINAEAVTDTRLASTIGGRCQGAHRRAPDVGLRGPGYRQPVCGHHRRRSAHPGWFIGIVRFSAAKRRHRIAERTPRFIRVTRPVEVREGEGAHAKWARLTPYHGYKLSFEIDFDHPAVDSTGQRVEFDLGSGNYSRDIARARTFGFTRDVEMMRASGLALGGGLDNAIVMDDYKVLNSDGLRYDDEFVKHKILDAMGDLYLVGKPLLAAYSAFRSGHAMNNLLLRELLAQRDAWEVVTFEDERQAPSGLLQPVRAW